MPAHVNAQAGYAAPIDAISKLIAKLISSFFYYVRYSTVALRHSAYYPTLLALAEAINACALNLPGFGNEKNR